MQEVEMKEKEEVYEVSLSGDIDSGKSQEFFNLVTAPFEREPKDVIFRCENLNFIDSTTLGTFVKILKRVRSSGKNMKLTGLQAKIKKLFTICSLDTIMEME